MFELPDSYYQPPDPPDDLAQCHTCRCICYKEEVLPEGCAHCGGRVTLAEFRIGTKYRVYGYMVERVVRP